MHSAAEVKDRVETFQKDGFVRIPEVISAQEAATYAQKLEVLIEKQDARWGDFDGYLDRGMVHNPMAEDPDFLDFLAKPSVLDHLEGALDPHCILYAFTTSSMLPSEGNFSTRVHVDCPRIIPGYVSNVGFLVALTPFTNDTGASYYLPGSFETEQVDDNAFHKGAVRPQLNPGDAVMFNARTWHSGGQNKTDHPRHALTLNVCRSYMKQRFDYPRLLGKRLLQERDERLLRFLGYRTRVPASLDEYYVPKEERLYWGGQG